MRQYLYIPLLIWLMLGSVGGSLFAQSTSNPCTRKLVELDSVLINKRVLRAKLKREVLSCLDADFSKPQKIEAYQLLTEWYLLQGVTGLDSAKLFLEKLLRLKPEYDQTDNSEDFKDLAREFSVRPFHAWRLSLGPHFSTVRPGQFYGLDNTSYTDSSLRSPSLGWQIHAGWEYLFKNRREASRWRLAVLLDLGLSQSRYSLEHVQQTLFSPAAQFSRLAFSEVQYWFSATGALRLSYLWQEKSTHGPFVLAGPSYQNLLRANIENITRSTRNANFEEVGLPVSGLTHSSLMDQREKHNLSLVVGLGYNLKFQRHHFFLEVRGVVGLTNLVQVANRYEHQELVYKYGYVDPDLVLRQGMIQIGYRYPLYRVKRK